MSGRHLVCIVTLSIGLAACAGGGSDVDPTSASAGSALAGKPDALDIGFNGGSGQFAYFHDFFNAKDAVTTAGPRLCHGYVPWNILARKSDGDLVWPSQLHGLKTWLSAAQGECEEALISFQADAPQSPPSQHDYKLAFLAFVETDWASETGFTGDISYTPWNEPNNKAGDGNGLGVRLPAETAATYYLTAAHVCASHGCKVAAGDFASNGDFWDDYEWNCADDDVAPGDLCNEKSSENTDGKGASYLDVYKNFIVHHAEGYSLGASFRPAYWALHGWHDINEYMATGNRCGTYGDCVTRRLAKSLGGTWQHAEIWDTEVGVGQNQTYSAHDQACGAAFLLDVSTIDSRVTRMYYTRLHGGGEQLVDGTTVRPALAVLARRDTALAGDCSGVGR
jgi:hypothetical protein